MAVIAGSISDACTRRPGPSGMQPGFAPNRPVSPSGNPAQQRRGGGTGESGAGPREGNCAVIMSMACGPGSDTWAAGPCAGGGIGGRAAGPGRGRTGDPAPGLHQGCQTGSRHRPPTGGKCRRARTEASPSLSGAQPRPKKAVSAPRAPGRRVSTGDRPRSAGRFGREPRTSQNTRGEASRRSELARD